jgi:hypothetical protein
VTIEPHAQPRQAIEVRRFHDRHAIATEAVAHVVGTDEEDVTPARAFEERGRALGAGAREGRSAQRRGGSRSGQRAFEEPPTADPFASFGLAHLTLRDEVYCAQ